MSSKNEAPERPTRGRGWLTVSLVSPALLACNLDVSNPGPVEDHFLDEPAALPALVNGAARALNDAIGAAESSLGFTGAAISREFHPGGQTGSYGTSILVSRGFLTPDDIGGEVDEAQLARWLAEEAVRRIRDVLGEEFASSEVAARGLLYVGYSNRLLGEHMCQAVIDGGGPQAFMIHFERAEAAFSEAIDIAMSVGNDTVTHAALAGRASVRTWLGDWEGAVDDASSVPRGFKYQAQYNKLARSQANAYYFSNTPAAFRTVTYWHTFYAQNYDQFDDPRTAYATYEDVPYTQGAMWDLGDGRGELGFVPFYQQLKYTAESSPIDLSDYREAQLIIAEGLLRQERWQEAMEIVNSIRMEVGVASRQADSVEEAWSWMKVETAIELWLEARWLGKRRRWFGDGVDQPAPGALPPLLRMDDRPGKDRCFPISQDERETNPNIPST